MSDVPYTVREPTAKKVTTSSGETRELRRLTPEEKAARRFRRNLILMTIGIIVLASVMAVLQYFGGK